MNSSTQRVIFDLWGVTPLEDNCQLGSDINAAVSRVASVIKIVINAHYYCSLQESALKDHYTA